MKVNLTCLSLWVNTGAPIYKSKFDVEYIPMSQIKAMNSVYEWVSNWYFMKEKTVTKLVQTQRAQTHTFTGTNCNPSR